MTINISFTGNLGSDPEAANSDAGPARISVAATSGWGDKKKTVWFRVNCWRATREYAMTALRKGDVVTVNGRMSVDEWEGRDGGKRTTLEVDCTELEGPFKRRPREEGGYSQGGERSKPSGGYGGGYTGGGSAKHVPDAGGYGGGESVPHADDEEIPFAFDYIDGPNADLN
jgi:single-strand DNA-binding protein